MRLSSAHRWLLAAGATAASTYALDAAATAAGAVLLVAGPLEGSTRGQLLAFLTASYLVWALGLRVALAANWHLLCTTGTSLNLPSLLAFDAARRYTGNARLHRLAAGVGYVGTEVAKEAPYYVAAFGAAALSDELTSDDALIFLIGTNLGAAAYECAIGLALRLSVRRMAGSVAVIALAVS
jgi:hypothetical protein